MSKPQHLDYCVSILPPRSPARGMNVLLVGDESCDLLASALLGVPMNSGQPSMEGQRSRRRKRVSSQGAAVEALSRALNLSSTLPSQSKRKIHRMQQIEESVRCHMDHVVLTINPATIGTSLNKSSILWDDPLLQKNLSRIHPTFDAMRMSRVSIVILVTEEEEVHSNISLTPSKKRKRSNTSSFVEERNFSVFYCRPDDSNSCHVVARMLWKRVQLGIRQRHDASSMVSPLVVDSS